MAFIKVIEHEEADGQLKEIYDHLVETRGKLADVHKIQSLHPESIVAHMDLYMKIMFGASPLRRYQREMMAVVVSVNNNCDYCKTHHGAALNHYWKDQSKVALLAEDFEATPLNDIDRHLCRLAASLTRMPHLVDDTQHINPLKLAGLTDRAILDATLVIAYFNFVNRIVLGLGVNLESDKGEGYKYG